MAKEKKAAQPIPKAYANAARNPRDFEMHPTDANLFWGILGGVCVLVSILMLALVVTGKIENVKMVLVWIICMLGLPSLGYIVNKEFCFKIKNKQIIRRCFMMQDRIVNLSDIMYYEEKPGRNPEASFLYLHYMNRGRKVYMKIPASYTNYDLMQQVIKTYKWKKRSKL